MAGVSWKDIMTLIDSLPTKPSRLASLGAGALAAWALLYWTNEWLWSWLMYTALGLDANNRIVETVHFFLYDTVKISLLLVGIIFVITFLRSYMSIERTRALLGGKRAGLGNIAAAGLGVITPFCSCSAVPAFIGFVAAGVPVGVTMSFLIASPLVNEVAIGLLLSLFGWQITLIYVASGLLIAIVAGLIIGRVRPERWVEKFVFETHLGDQIVDPSKGLSIHDRVGIAMTEVSSIVRKVWPYLLVGIGLGAIIHGWAPADFFASFAGPDNLFAVPLVTAIGVPLYSNAAGVLPMVESLYAAGLPIGTLMAFMMSVVALSLPELILLKRVLRPQLLAIFVGITAAGIMAVGYLLNALVAY